MKNSRKDFSKFKSRTAHSRSDKSAARRTLMRILDEIGADSSSVKIRDSVDLGRRGRSTPHAGRDESEAQGVFSSSRSGFGFVRLEGVDRDIFIPQDKTLGAIDGDTVDIIYHSYKNYLGEEKTEGRVVRIAEQARRTLIGTLSEEYSRHGRRIMRTYTLIPDDSHVFLRPYVTDTGDARPGDKVEVKIIRDGTSRPEARVLRSFGDSESLGANYAAVLAESGIVTDFTEAELAEADRAAEEPITDEGRVRRDGEIIFTIDGEGAKDLDDAVSLRLTRDGYRLGVHIADVSHYVRERTALDRCAMSRGTSVYFTDKVAPMLPTALSNGACSLNAGEEKYALSAIIDLDREGEIVKTKLEKSVIVSRVRGVYSEVNAIFDGTAAADIKKKYKSVIPTLTKMRALYEVLLKKSDARGFIEFDERECEILLGDNGCVTDIVRRERGVAERMIEQFMLTANEAVATLLTERGIPCVYRVHSAPPEDKASELLRFASCLGLDISGTSAGLTPRRLDMLLDSARKIGAESALSYVMLRSMAKAKYSEILAPHFGLGLERYCHFTSPIRRLSDLATHRIITRVLIEDKRAELYTSYAKRAAAAASEGELRALGAERKIDDLYKTLYMSEHVGECFDATVSSVTSFGMFCELDNTCEGLIPMSLMPGEFFFDEKNLALRSRSVTYRIADRVRIRVEEADMIRGKLRFSVAEKNDEA